MTAIEWDKAGERVFESGVDRGVLYDPEGIGVPWNGLTGVEENNNNQVESVYWDGIKSNDIVTVGEFSGTLRAFTYPDEFLECEGTFEDEQGLLITDQPPKRFHLSYRTGIGNDLNPEAGYKIHLLYNLTANPAPKNYQTLGLDGIVPGEFEWSLTSIPEELAGYRPTAHIIIDSRKIVPDLLADVEAILYGDEENDPKMPALKAIVAFIRKWNRLIITDNGDGTWTATDQDGSYVSLIGGDQFEITTDTAEYLDANTFTISSSDKNEEDI